MKKVIVEHDIRFICPNCRECRASMMLIKNGRKPNFDVSFADIGDEISCVSCDEIFKR